MEKYFHKIMLSAFSVALLISFSVGIAHGGEKGHQIMEWFDLLPGRIDGWSVSGKDRSYTRDTIFDYMNGGGEMYLAYDFRKLFVREYAKPSAPSIVAEVYQMASSEDAFGILTNDTGGKAVKLGQGALYAEGLLRFWKNDVFVRVHARKETDETRATLLKLGQEIADSVPKDGRLPTVVACLPTDGLIDESVHYFHTQSTLNFLYYLANTNLLNLNPGTEAVLARYQIANHKIRLLLVSYPAPESAKRAYQQFVSAYFPDRPQSTAPIRIEKVENDKFVGALWKDGFVILVFEAQNEETCKKLYEAVESRIKEVQK